MNKNESSKIFIFNAIVLFGLSGGEDCFDRFRS